MDDAIADAQVKPQWRNLEIGNAVHEAGSLV
jgi:hypothetical protein